VGSAPRACVGFRPGTQKIGRGHHGVTFRPAARATPPAAWSRRSAAAAAFAPSGVGAGAAAGRPFLRCSHLWRRPPQCRARIPAARRRRWRAGGRDAWSIASAIRCGQPEAGGARPRSPAGRGRAVCAAAIDRQLPQFCACARGQTPPARGLGGAAYKAMSGSRWKASRGAARRRQRRRGTQSARCRRRPPPPPRMRRTQVGRG